jgi:hypothetical protein
MSGTKKQLNWLLPFYKWSLNLNLLPGAA